MPFESKFTKEEIIDAAFEIAKEKGFSAITARTVAKKIKGSVAPIYFNFENIQELIDAVVEKVFTISKDILREQQTPNLYESIGRAGFVFADRYPVFFRELILNPNPYIGSYESTENQMIESLKDDPLVSKLSIKDRKILILKMKALQIGFQTLVANEQLPSFITKDEMQELYIELGHDLAQLQVLKKKD
jgi:AcrR family transcriptional regulator